MEIGDGGLTPGSRSCITFAQAINDATRQAMELDPRVFVFGIGVDSKAGVFGSTARLKDQFGPERVFDTPVSEQALTAVAGGAANAGLRPVLVHQRFDFMSYTMDQFVNWIGPWRFKSAGRSSMPLTVRAIVGKGWGQGPQHAKSLHAWLAHVPGMQVVTPSSPAEAKGLLLASIFSEDPTIFVEGRSLYAMQEEVPDAPYFIRLGKALLRREGSDVTVVSFGSMIPAVLQAAEELEKMGVSAEVVDLRCLAPLDMRTVLASVARTGRLVVAEPGWRSFGAAAEIVSSVVEELGTQLKACPRRVAWPDSHVPTAASLEAQYYPAAADIVTACKGLL